MADDNRVRKYINAVKRRIKEDYGSVPEEWSAQLQQLEDLYSCYLRASDAQRDSEITTTINNSKTICKSPYFTIMLDCTNAMKKVIAEFGLSPRAKAMIKTVPTTDNDDFIDNFLSD